MKFASLIAATVLLGAGLTALQLLGSESIVGPLTGLTIIDAKALAALGCFVALFQFGPRDYLRRAWGLLAFGSVLLAEADVAVVVLSPVASPGAVGVTRGVLVIAANLASPIAMVMFARSLAVAGLDLAGSRSTRAASYGIAVLVAVLIAGPSAYLDLRALAGGDLMKVHALASDIGDIVSLTLIAPLVYNVVTLRGGTLLWPFVMLASSRVAWLAYDSVELFGMWAGHSPLAAALKQGCRLSAVLFLFVAGLTQRWALARTPQPVSGVREMRTAAAA